MANPGGISLSLLLVIAGVVLAIAEALAPGAHFIVLGVALLAAGLVGLLLGPVLPAVAGPFALAVLVVVFGAAALLVYREFDLYGSQGIARTTDSGSLRGQTGRVTRRVTETSGQVKLDRGGFNPYYAARSTLGAIPKGTEVIVIDPGGGNVLTVESLEAVEEDEIDRALAAGREPEPETEE